MDIIKYTQDKIDLWERGTIQVVPGLDYNPYETLRRIAFYSDSKYVLGQKDDRNRTKPFYNIVNYRVNIATRATDIDTKDINIIADAPQFAPLSFILQKEVYNWMKEVDFAKTLNEMGFTRAKYGGVLVKKCLEQEEGEQEELEIDVVDWRNVVVDPTNPDEMVIEKHFMSDSDLADKMDVWDYVPESIDQARKNADGKLEILEITANLPESYSPDGGDPYTFKIQKFYICKMKKNKGMVLYHEYLDEFPYKYLAWETVNGRLGRGIVEDGFEAQMWTNDAVVKEKEAMELGSKVVFTTTDPNIQNNILSEVENGQIIQRTAGTEFGIANTITNALPEFRNLVQAWDSQLEHATGTYNAITGETMPSGTAYRSVAIQNQEATSNFDYRREEMGIFLVELFTDWIIPYLIKKLNKAHILSAEFSTEELNAIDDSYATFKTNEQVMELILSGKPIYQSDYAELVNVNKELIQRSKNTRFLDIPKNLYKGWEPKVTILTTGEQKNKAVILDSLNNILITVAKAPQILTDPTLSKVFGKILEVSGSGISPISLGMGTQAPTMDMQQALPQETQQPQAPVITPNQ